MSELERHLVLSSENARFIKRYVLERSSLLFVQVC